MSDGPTLAGVDPVTDARRDAVLRAFLDDEGRLHTMPARHAKRLVVLDHVARAFDIGVHYSEREVDAVLKSFHADHAALRRHLVEDGFLDRERGEYWRSGGTVLP